MGRLNLRRTQMPRRRRRRRRRPPSKCHLLTVEAVEKCSKHSFYLRALKITVIRNPFNCLTLAVRPRCVSSSEGLRPILQHKKSQKKENLQQIKIREKLLIDRQVPVLGRKVEEIERRAILFLDQSFSS